MYAAHGFLPGDEREVTAQKCIRAYALAPTKERGL